MITILRDKGYSGIIISAQYISSENQNLFYNYTKRFSDRLQQEGFLTFIAINPKVDTFSNQVIFEAIDYSNISETVSSILFMQYLWGFINVPPAPVISISNLSIFLDYALSQIEPDKIVIGIPILGYIWELPYVSGLSVSSVLTRENVLTLARDVGATIQFDEASQSPYFTFETKNDGNTQYIVWFVNSITVDSLIRLILEKGVSGTGVWNIMSYFAQLWLVVNCQYEIVKLLPEF